MPTDLIKSWGRIWEAVISGRPTRISAALAQHEALFEESAATATTERVQSIIRNADKTTAAQHLKRIRERTGA